VVHDQQHQLLPTAPPPELQDCVSLCHVPLDVRVWHEEQSLPLLQQGTRRLAKQPEARQGPPGRAAGVAPRRRPHGPDQRQEQRRVHLLGAP